MLRFSPHRFYSRAKYMVAPNRKPRRFKPNLIPGIPYNHDHRPTINRPKGEEKVMIEGYFGDALLRDKSPRELKIEELTETVFSKGNRHIKNSDELRTIPQGLLSFPEVCIVGNTGSGKSRLCAALLHNAKLGRAGPNSGTTTFLQFFSVGDSLMIVDTPGYGEWSKFQRTPLGKSNRTTQRAQSQALTKQYICLRKHSNLKRVYLCIAADRGVQHRDKEFIRFLMGEGVPFTIVMTFIDSLVKHTTALQSEFRRKEVLAEIPVAAQRIFDALGTDEVPFIEVSARNGYNIDALQKDIMFQCCQDLEKDEDLTVKNLRQLSYSPPAAASFIAAEARYPPELELLIDNDDVTEKEYIAQHLERLKTDSQEIGRLTPFATLEQFAKGLAPNANKLEAYSAGALTDSHGTASMKPLDFSHDSARAKFLAMEKKKKQLLLGDAGGSNVDSSKTLALVTNENDTPEQLMKKYIEFEKLQEEKMNKKRDANKKKNSSILLGSDVFTSDKYSAKNNKLASSSSLSAKDVTPSSTSTSTSSVFLQEFDDSSPAVTRPPLSLQNDNIIEGLQKMEKSPHRYKQLIENGWQQVLDEKNQFFRLEHETLGEKGSFDYRRRQAMRRYIDKDGLRKERPLKMDYQAWMNPYVGQQGAAQNVVFGMDPSVRAPSSVTGTSKGSKMLGLKSKTSAMGRGPSSLPDKTIRGRGRKSEKLADWAR